MKEDLLKIINHYGVMKQLKYFQSEVFELNEAIITREIDYNSLDATEKIIEIDKQHIAEEIADVMVMLKQFQYYYGIGVNDIEKVVDYKIKRQLERISKGE
jgi:NTP pyrophosphatase (non-canonical NTP hydrolase)